MNNTAYKALLEESQRVGWPLHYQTDLTEHDRKRLLHDDPPAEFVWVLRDMGTELLDTRMGLNSARAYMEHYRLSPNGKRFYVWNGTILREVSQEEARRFLLESASRSGDADRNFARY